MIISSPSQRHVLLRYTLENKEIPLGFRVWNMLWCLVLLPCRAVVGIVVVVTVTGRDMFRPVKLCTPSGQERWARLHCRWRWLGLLAGLGRWVDFHRKAGNWRLVIHQPDLMFCGCAQLTCRSQGLEPTPRDNVTAHKFLDLDQRPGGPLHGQAGRLSVFHRRPEYPVAFAITRMERHNDGNRIVPAACHHLTQESQLCGQLSR